METVDRTAEVCEPVLESTPRMPREQAVASAADLYLNLLRKCLTDTLYLKKRVAREAAPGSGIDPHDLRCRIEEGRSVWPADAETMIGFKRLDNIRHCVEAVLRSGVPGDLVETGVWRGGATIFMRGILKAYGVTDRVVWAADSFCGLPPPDPTQYPADEGDTLYKAKILAVSLEDVQQNFARYDLLDSQVRFLKGWFRDTLPQAPIERIAVLRLDGDLYESTILALRSLYDRVSVGGYVLVDDYGCMECCKSAIHDFRRERSIDDPIIEVDWTGVYWQRTS